MSIWYCKRRDVLTGPMGCCPECERVEILHGDCTLPPHTVQEWSSTASPANVMVPDAYALVVDGKVVECDPVELEMQTAKQYHTLDHAEVRPLYLVR